MRFRPANISLINRRHYLPRLLLTLSSKVEQQRQTHQSVPLDRVTPYQRPLSCVVGGEKGLMDSEMEGGDPR